jgi:hypothetical protein
MVGRERERILTEVESETHCAMLAGFPFDNVSEVNWGRRGDIVVKGTW